MSPMSPASAQALDRLRAYSPPSPSIYYSLPLTRRAAVLILLFADRRGDLNVVLTVRSAQLRTFAGQVALPGGKADYLSETAAQTARREAWEEIGLPLDSRKFPSPFSVEHLTELPCSMARTNLGVRPCVAFLRDNSADQSADIEDRLIPRLEEQEVASVFTVPLERFLSPRYLLMDRGGVARDEKWYQGNWINWNGRRWRMHEFQAPIWERATLKRYRVWGMTARIMVDVSRIAYGKDPDYEFNDTIGDEDMITNLWKNGQMDEKMISKARPGSEAELKEAVDQIKKGNL
ncbi:NUDIX hydrolase domain-like protein [Geopyxis carbonaria]|nr:NUDIX hydrolase domain-like protein [Geopyxis carbonaria]